MGSNTEHVGGDAAPGGDQTRGQLPSEDLLKLLRCPETLQVLRLAPAELVGRVNRERLPARNGAPLTVPIAHGLVREDGAVLYRIDDGIPVLLIDLGIPLSPTTAPPQLHTEGDRI